MFSVLRGRVKFNRAVCSLNNSTFFFCWFLYSFNSAATIFPPLVLMVSLTSSFWRMMFSPFSCFAAPNRVVVSCASASCFAFASLSLISFSTFSFWAFTAAIESFILLWLISSLLGCPKMLNPKITNAISKKPMIVFLSMIGWLNFEGQS